MLTGVSELTDAQARLLDEATAADAGSARLNDIEHVIILMQENRSFDHYFGTMSGVRGFSDPDALPGVFDQADPHGPGGVLQPFRLWSDPPSRDGQSLNDISHTWPTQHLSWNHGKLDAFVTAHLAANGPEDGPVTMGYYTRADLPFYYALADAFTVCDGYFSSVLGPTDSNRVMAMSGTIDPDGVAGGPVLETYIERVTHYGKLRWETMPERLLEAGVSWKVYSPRLAELALSPLPYFKAFADPLSVRGVELVARVLRPRATADGACWDAGRVADRRGRRGRRGGCRRRGCRRRCGAAGRRGWYQRSGGPRFPDRVPGRLAVQPRWLRVLRCVRPHVAAAVHREAVRCRGAEPVRVAAGCDRRLRAGLVFGARCGGAAAAADLARRRGERRRAGGAQRFGGEPGPGNPVPAAGRQLDAGPGDRTRTPAAESGLVRLRRGFGDFGPLGFRALDHT